MWVLGGVLVWGLRGYISVGLGGILVWSLRGFISVGS